MVAKATHRQLTYIHLLWRDRMRLVGLDGHPESRELRHAFVRAVTAGRAQETRQLTADDAALVIERLLTEKRTPLHIDDEDMAHAAGTHGRRDDAHRNEARGCDLPAGPPQWALISTLQEKLGWDHRRLGNFIHHQLGPNRHIETMAECNRVIWGMKSLLRRSQQTAGC